MNCEKCGTEILPGQLLCPKCGWEVRMVPDFEDPVDSVVSDAIEDIAGDIVKTQEEEEENLRVEENEYRSYRMHLHSTVLTGIVIGIVVLIIIVKVSLQGPQDPGEEAQNAFSAGDYNAAIDYYEEIIKAHPEDSDSYMNLADSYRLAGRTEDAQKAYQLLSSRGNEEVSLRATRALIDMYIDMEDYHQVNEILKTPQAQELVGDYMDYISFEPTFSIAEDTYDQPVYVKLLSEGSGDIYYTLDGSDPDSTSTRYDSPILLEKGVYTLKAVTINSKGVMSDTATGVYEIASPEEIDILPLSGIYTSPDYITVNTSFDSDIYYTTDETEPDSGSTPYTGALILPQGHSVYRFLVINKLTGVMEYIDREYDFDFSPELTQENARNALLLELVGKGIISNLLGAVPGSFGYNVYTQEGVVSIDGGAYYLFREFFQMVYPNAQETGNNYCVDASNGAVYRAVWAGDGRFELSPF